MADTTTTPNMNLPVPVASAAPGPDWASDIVTDMYAIDSHDHSSGNGVPITPGGLSINSNLPFGNNNATAVKSVRFTAQGSPLAAGADLGCIYVSGVDLYYNDENGNQVRITTGGNVNAGAGSITGLPSGTASVAFSAGTYTFQSATSTGATISAGPVAIGSTTASGKHTTLASAGAQAADISLVLPTAAPPATSVMTSDASGNMAWTGVSGTGSIVRDTGASLASTTISSPAISTPTFSGAPAGTIIGDTYTPTITNVTGTTTGAGFRYHRIGDIVLVTGGLSFTPSGGATGFLLSLPIAPTSNFSLTSNVTGMISAADTTVAGSFKGGNVQASAGAKTASVVVYTSNSSAYAGGITFAYSCA